MEELLKDFLMQQIGREDEQYYYFVYNENNNRDALSDLWLENNTSYIYKVGILAAIDRNKCDFVKIAIASQRSEKSQAKIIGFFDFDNGENDDIGRTIDRAVKLIQWTHPAFEL